MNIHDDITALLYDHDIDIESNIDFDVNGKCHTLSFKEITQSYMQASDESQLVFYSALQKAISAGNMGVESFFEGMGKLLLMSQLSEKFES